MVKICMQCIWAHALALLAGATCILLQVCNTYDILYCPCKSTNVQDCHHISHLYYMCLTLHYYTTIGKTILHVLFLHYQYLYSQLRILYAISHGLHIQIFIKVLLYVTHENVMLYHCPSRFLLLTQPVFH